MCVCVPPSVSRRFVVCTFPKKQGRQARYTYLTQRSSGVSRDGWTDHPPAPASSQYTNFPRGLLIPWFLHNTPQNIPLRRSAAADSREISNRCSKISSDVANLAAVRFPDSFPRGLSYWMKPCLSVCQIRCPRNLATLTT